MTETSHQAFACGRGEELQAAPNQNFILQHVMKEGEKKDGTIFSTEAWPISVQNEIGATTRRISNAQLAFIRLAMTTLEAFLVNKATAHTHEEISGTVSSRLEKNGFSGDKPTLSSIERISRSEMISYQSIAKTDNAEKSAITSDDAMERIDEVVGRLYQRIS